MIAHNHSYAHDALAMQSAQASGHQSVSSSSSSSAKQNDLKSRRQAAVAAAAAAAQLDDDQGSVSHDSGISHDDDSNGT